VKSAPAEMFILLEYVFALCRLLSYDVTRKNLTKILKKDIISFAGEEIFSCTGESYIKGTHKIWNKQPYVGRLFLLPFFMQQEIVPK
jgi:hypothetical protein